MKKKNDITIYQNKKSRRQNILENMGLLLLGSSIFIDADAELSWIQSLTTSGESVCILDFWHVRSAIYDTFLSHDLIHHKVKNLVINLPAVFTSFQRRFRIWRDIFWQTPTTYKWCLNSPSSKGKSVCSTLSPWSMEKEEAERHL